MSAGRDSGQVEHPIEYVVGVDGSPASLRAARWAADRAARDGAKLVVVHAFQIAALPSVAGPMRTPAMRRSATQRAEERLRACLIDLPDTVDAVIIEGPADRVLIQRSKDAGLLVLGARSQHTHPQMRFLGMTALRCLRGARCPVVMVPVQQMTRGVSAATSDAAAGNVVAG